MITPTLSVFPLTPSAKDATGVPFGVVVQPLAPLYDEAADEVAEEDLEHVDEVARCESCFAYINPFCAFLRSNWRCSLCGTLNPLTKRYAESGDRSSLPELAEAAVELTLGNDASPQPPVCIAMVDVSGGDDAFLETARAGLHAAVAALCESAPTTLFGIIEFSDLIGAHLLTSAVPYVKLLPLPAEGEPEMPLLEVAAWSKQLTAVGSGAARIGASIEALRSRSVKPGQERRCGLGPALREVLDALSNGPDDELLGTISGFDSVRLLLMLGGPPNYGDGKLPPAKPSGGGGGGAAGGARRQPTAGRSTAAAAAAGDALRLMDMEAALEALEGGEVGGGGSGEGGGGRGGGGGVGGGVGGTDAEAVEEAEMAVSRPRKEARLYEQLGEDAAALGVAISLFCVAPEGGGANGGGSELAALRALPLRSGGLLNFYAGGVSSAVEASALTDDVYKQLAAPYGSQLLVRLRAHSDLHVGRAYGMLEPDAQVAQLYHLAGCHAHTTVGFDLEFASSAGFNLEFEVVPTLQLAVMYTTVVRATAPDGDDGDDGDGDGADAAHPDVAEAFSGRDAPLATSAVATDAKADAAAAAAATASPATAVAASGPLPAGWVSGTDPASGRTYYCNPARDFTQWERPTAPAPARLGAVVATAEAEAAAAAAQKRAAAAAARGPGWVVVRRMRLHTVQLRVARTTRQVLESVQPEPMMCLLAHKVMRAAVDEGFREGRLLLQDWLVVLLAKHVVATHASEADAAQPESLVAPLRPVPRWVFALLRGPLLSSNTPLSPDLRHVSVDGRVALLALYSSLPPACLLTAVHPRLYPYQSAEARPTAPLPLSWTALRASGCRLFLLDAYTTLFVYLAAPPLAAPPGSTAPPTAGPPPPPTGAAPPPPAAAPDAPPPPPPDDVEFPPSKRSVLWRHVAKIKSAQLQTPKVVVCRHGTADGAAFEAHLIEDLPGGAPRGGRGSYTFGQFVDWNQQELADAINDYRPEARDDYAY